MRDRRRSGRRRGRGNSRPRPPRPRRKRRPACRFPQRAGECAERSNFDCTGRSARRIDNHSDRQAISTSLNARSIAPAAVVSDQSRRSEVTMPMGPDSLNTGTTGARLKGHIDCKSSKDGRLTVRSVCMPETATRSPSAAHSCLWLGVCGENGAGRATSIEGFIRRRPIDLLDLGLPVFVVVLVSGGLLRRRAAGYACRRR